jgi:hypothetical protein
MQENNNPNPYGVKVGEVWVENDPRHPHRKKVVGFLLSKSPEGFGYAKLENVLTGKGSIARLDRFNGKRGGYSKVETK